MILILQVKNVDVDVDVEQVQITYVTNSVTMQRCFPHIKII